jgi:hypothetical protein
LEHEIVRIVRATPTQRFVHEIRWDRREFSSPVGERTLVLRDAFEWHMGATGWKASLLPKGRNITLRHWRMTRLAGKTGFQDDSPQPWSADGRTVHSL